MSRLDKLTMLNLSEIGSSKSLSENSDKQSSQSDDIEDESSESESDSESESKTHKTKKKKNSLEGLTGEERAKKIRELEAAERDKKIIDAIK